jgi:PHD/YefM family antitoxin component YafN of YafNO toxin-antitoxin module
MSGPQIIRTPGGEELVVLPRAEYEALLERADREAEDAEDVAIYDARKAELAAACCPRRLALRFFEVRVG